jgi:hypothetical protein
MIPLIRNIGKVFLIICILSGIILSHVSQADAPNVTVEQWISNTSWNQSNIESMIRTVCSAYEWNDPDLLISLAKIESINLTKPFIIDTNGLPSRGLYHFQESAWNQYCVDQFHLQDDIENPTVQTICVIKMGKLNLIHVKWVNSYKKITNGKM